MKKLNKMPTFWFLLLTFCILTFLSCMERKTLYGNYSFSPFKEPVLTVFMQGLGDRVFPWNDSASSTEASLFEKSDMVPAETTFTQELNTEISQDASSKSDSTSDNNQTYSFTTADSDYFNNALFIGDSRTVGLHDYSSLKTAHFYAKVSSTIYDIMDTPLVKIDPSEIKYYGSQELSIRQTLSFKHFEKIYIMVGINELGTGTAETYFEQYKKVIEDLRALQPDATIFIQSVMHVTTQKSEEDAIYNNQNIDERNDLVKSLADNKSIFYLDINEPLDDDTHGLNPEYTFDSIHLKASWYHLWEDYLKTHAIIKNK